MKADYKHILIVDDDEEIRAVLKHIFQKLKPNYQISLASNGFMALDRMFQQVFDLMIVDYQMPGLDGLELTEAVNSISPRTNVLLISSVNPFQDTDTFASKGLAGFLRKPFSFEQLFDMIEQIDENITDEIIPV